MQLAIVTWADAHFSENEGELKDLEKNHSPVITKTIGFIFKDDATGVTMVHEIYEDSHGFGNSYKYYAFIPRAMIIKVTKLKEIGKRSPR